MTGTPVTGSTGATDRSRRVLGGFLVGMGVLHFAVPQPFMRLIPRRLGHPRFWTYASGVAELGSGSLLLSHDAARNRLGGKLAAATIVAVYPGNVQMALDAGRPRDVRSAAAWLRLPFQWPLFRWAVRHAR